MIRARLFGRWSAATVSLIVLVALAFISTVQADEKSDYGITDAHWLATSESVAFTFREPGSNQQTIFRLDLSTGDVRQLTSGERFDSAVCPSPDGTSILFVSRPASEEFESRRLYLMNKEGNSLRRLTTLDQEEGSASWSSDAQNVTFIANHSVYVSRLSEQREVQLTPANLLCFFPVFVGPNDSVLFWSPTWFGHSSPVASSTYHDFAPAIVHVGLRRLEHFALPRMYTLKHVSVSADASHIMWSESDYVPWVIATFDARDLSGVSDATRDTDKNLPVSERQFPRVGYACFTPDGTSVIGWKGPRDDSALWSISLNDLSERTLLPLGKLRPATAAITPDGKRVLAVVGPNPKRRNNELSLWILDIESNELMKFDTSWMLNRYRNEN